MLLILFANFFLQENTVTFDQKAPKEVLQDLSEFKPLNFSYFFFFFFFFFFLRVEFFGSKWTQNKAFQVL